MIEFLLAIPIGKNYVNICDNRHLCLSVLSRFKFMEDGKTGFCCPIIRASNANSGFIKSRSGQEPKKLNLPPGWSDSVIEEKLSEIAADDIKLAKRTGKPRSSGLGLFNKLREADKENAEIALRLAKLNADSAISPRQVRDENVISEIFDI